MRGFKIFIILLLYVEAIAFFQDDYTLKHESVSIDDYNKAYFENPQVVMFWFNRTTRAFNGSVYLKKELGHDQHVNVSVYKFLNNQYRYIPVEFKKNPCDLFEANVFGVLDIVKQLNVTKCPVPPGYYSLGNVILNVQKFPPHLLPFGKYKVKVSIWSSDVYLATGSWTGEILAVTHVKY